jgi:hypothetical protein
MYCLLDSRREYQKIMQRCVQIQIYGKLSPRNDDPELDLNRFRTPSIVNRMRTGAGIKKIVKTKN